MGWRRSRTARWLIRPAAWTIVGLVLVLFLALKFIEGRWVSSWLAGQVESRVSAGLDRPVEVGSVDLDLIPLSATLEDVVIAGKDTAEPPFARLERLRVEAYIDSFWRRQITLRRLEIIRPEVRIEFDEDGNPDTPRWTRTGGDRRLGLLLGWVEIRDGIFELDHRRYDLDLSARNVVALLQGAEGSEAGEGLSLEGRARAEEVSFRHGDAEPYLGSLTMQVALDAKGFTLRSGTLEAPDVRAEVYGRWTWGQAPEARFRIDAGGRLAVLDRLGYGNGLLAGPFEFAGAFVRSGPAWSVSGDLESRRVTVLERDLADVRGRIVADAEGLRVQIERADYSGGDLRGAVKMASGSRSSPGPSQSQDSARVETGASEPDVEIDLRLEGVALDALLADQKIPLAGFASRADGAITYQFERSQPDAGHGWADLEIRPAEGPGIPMSGSAVLNIGEGVLSTEAVRLQGDGHLIQAEGSYDIADGSGAFDFDVATDRVERVLELLPLPADESPWRPERGRGAIGGRVELAGERVVTQVDLDLEEVEAPGFAAKELRGRLRVEPAAIRDLRLELLDRDAAMIVAGEIDLADPEAPDLDLAIDAERWPLGQAAVWLPFELPADGDFSGAVTMRGAGEDLAATVRGQSVPLVLSGATSSIELDRLDADLALASGVLTVHEAELRLGEAAIRVLGLFDTAADRLDLAAESDGLAAADLLARFGGAGERRAELAGTVAIDARLTGSSALPDLALEARLDELTLGGRALGAGSGELEARWGDGRAELELDLPELLQVAGGGDVTGEAVDLSFAVEAIDLAALARLATDAELPGLAASAGGRLDVVGALGTESLPVATLALERLSLAHGDLALTNLEPVEARIEDGSVELVSLFLGDPAGVSELFVGGSLALSEPGAVDLNVQASMDAAWFEPWVPEGLEFSEGRFDVIGSVGGASEAIDFDGVGELVDGRILAPGLTLAARDTRAVLLFYPDQLVLDTLEAEAAGGAIRGAGSMRWDGDAPTYTFQVSGADMSLRYPEGWSIRADSDVVLASNPAGQQLTGTVSLDRALYLGNVPTGLDQLLSVMFARRRVEVGETDEWLSTTLLNLDVVADNTLRIRNNAADLTGSADLVIRGSLARPIVFGEVELEPGGELVYSGTEYRLERGLLSFTNPYRLQPVIDLVARADLRDYDLQLNLSGTPDQLDFDFVSDPPLAELEVLALLTGGTQPGEASLEGSGADDQAAAEGFLYGQAGSLVASRFNRLFGLDQFRIDPLTSSTGSLSSARVTVGKQLSRDLFATYSYDPSQTEEQVLELKWSLSSSVVLVLTQNGDGTYAVDAKWEESF